MGGDQRIVEGMAKMIVPFDMDDAAGLSSRSGDDTVAWATAQKGRGWYVTVVVDSNTGHFVADLATDDGPYKTEADAYEAGLHTAQDWFSDNYPGRGGPLVKDVKDHQREVARLRKRR